MSNSQNQNESAGDELPVQELFKTCFIFVLVLWRAEGRSYLEAVISFTSSHSSPSHRDLLKN